MVWLVGLWSIIFQLYRGGQFYWWKKPEYQEKTTDLSYQVHLAWVGFELTTLVVIGTDCIYSCKSNYRTTMVIKNSYTNAFKTLHVVSKKIISYVYLISG